jgi:hypothetical protein
LPGHHSRAIWLVNEKPVTPESADDFQVPALRREVLSELLGKRVEVSEKEDTIASVNRRVAAFGSWLAVGLDRLIDGWKRELLELAHLAVCW